MAEAIEGKQLEHKSRCVGLCLRPYGGPRGGAVSYERGTPVLNVRRAIFRMDVAAVVSTKLNHSTESIMFERCREKTIERKKIKHEIHTCLDSAEPASATRLGFVAAST